MALKFFHKKGIKKVWKIGFENVWEPCVVYKNFHTAVF